MRSITISPFWKLFDALPLEVQQHARQAFLQFQNDPFYPSLMFKEVNQKYDVWSARIDDQYRVLGYRRDGEIRWFWIGVHAEYDRIIGRMK